MCTSWYGHAIISAVLAQAIPVSRKDTEGMSKVYGMHRLTLKPGADAEEFERVVQECYPALDRIPDMRWRLLKGYEGDRQGKYLALYEFDSVERLRSYIPVHMGEGSEEFEAMLDPIRPDLERIAGFLVSISDPACTDYVVVGE